MSMPFPALPRNNGRGSLSSRACRRGTERGALVFCPPDPPPPARWRADDMGAVPAMSARRAARSVCYRAATRSSRFSRPPHAAGRWSRRRRRRRRSSSITTHRSGSERSPAPARARAGHGVVVASRGEAGATCRANRASDNDSNSLRRSGPGPLRP
jgi:hypothetical protein